jgi:hypothetical protein
LVFLSLSFLPSFFFFFEFLIFSLSVHFSSILFRSLFFRFLFFPPVSFRLSCFLLTLLSSIRVYDSSHMPQICYPFLVFLTFPPFFPKEISNVTFK